MSKFITINNQTYDMSRTPIAEIARQAGVTIGTVRRAVKEARVREQTKKAEQALRKKSQGSWVGKRKRK